MSSTATTDRLTVTVAIDMAADLAMACEGPRFDRADELDRAEAAEEWDQVDQIESAHQAEIDRLTGLWAEAAVRIGAERGYDVEITRDLARRTETPTESGDDTVEREIWQAAHDTIDRTTTMPTTIIVYPTVVDLDHEGIAVDAPHNRSLDLFADHEWVATLAEWTETDDHYVGELCPDRRAAVEEWATANGWTVADWTDHADLGDGNTGPAATLTR